MRRIKRWWWRVAFFLLAIVPGSVRVALDDQWWLLVPSIIGASGLVWLMWDDHCEHREGKEQQAREVHSRHESLADTMRAGFGDELPPLDASATIQSDTPRIRELKGPSLYWRRIRQWMAAKGRNRGWLK